MTSIIKIWLNTLSMPVCVERSLICLLCYIELQAKGIQFIPDTEFGMKSEFSLLRQYLKREKQETKNLIDFIQQGEAHAFLSEWIPAKDALEKALNQIRPFNIQKLLRLIHEIEVPVKLIEERPIILLLGATGSGKSTAIHFLAGSEMRWTLFNGLSHIVPRTIKNEALKNITIRSGGRSETQCIAAAPVMLRDIGIDQDGDIIFCDTPGFSDTRGFEVDVANDISIVRAAKICQSIKPLILINGQDFGHRLGGLKDIAYTLIGMIPDLKKHVHTFSYLFTNYPHNLSDISVRLNNLLDTMNSSERLNEGLVAFFEDMKCKAERGMIRLLDPIKHKATDFFDILLGSLEMPAPTIQDPKEVFHFSAGRALVAVREQVRLHISDIESALIRSDCKFIKYKLDELNALNAVFPQDFIRQSYDACIEHITNHLKEKYLSAIAAFKRALLDQIQLTEEDISQYKECINYIKNVEEILGGYVGKIYEFDTVIQMAISYATTITINEENESPDLVRLRLNNMKLISSVFEPLLIHYENACQHVTAQIKEIIETSRKLLVENSFNEILIDKMLRICKIYHSISNYLNSSHLTEIYDCFKESFLEHSRSFITKLEYLLDNLDENSIQKLNSYEVMVGKIKASILLKMDFSIEVLNDIEELFSSTILKYFEKLNVKINNFVQKKRIESFREMEKLVESIHAMKKISVIEARTSNSIFETIHDFLQEVIKEFDQLLNFFQKEEKTTATSASLFTHQLESTRDSCHQLHLFLFSFKKSLWIKKYHVELYDKVAHDVTEKVLSYITRLQKDIVDEITVEFENHENIETSYQQLSKLNIIVNELEEMIPELNGCRKDANLAFEQTVKGVFTKIRETLNFQLLETESFKKIDIEKIEKIICYLTSCKRIPVLREKANLLYNEVETFVKRYVEFTQITIVGYFEKIKNEYLKEDISEDISNETSNFIHSLKNLFKLQKKYPAIAFYFTEKEIFEKWDTCLLEYGNKLSNEMRRFLAFDQYKKLQNAILFCEELSQLDCFLSKKYNAIYSTYQDMFYNKIEQVKKEIIQHIQNHNYIDAALLLEQLNSPNTRPILDKIKGTSSHFVNGFINETTKKVSRLRHDLNIEDINNIIENVEKIESAKAILRYLDEKTQEKLSTTVHDIQNELSKKIIHFLNSIMASVISINFYEAEIKMETMDQISSLLGADYCKKDLQSKVQNVSNSLNTLLNFILQTYLELPIENYYCHSPKYLYEKFKKVLDKYPKYIEYWDGIERNISKKFEQKLKQIKESKVNANKHIREYEIALKYLPDKLQIIIKIELDRYKEEIESDDSVSYEEDSIVGQDYNMNADIFQITWVPYISPSEESDRVSDKDDDIVFCRVPLLYNDGKSSKLSDVLHSAQKMDSASQMYQSAEEESTVIENNFSSVPASELAEDASPVPAPLPVVVRADKKLSSVAIIEHEQIGKTELPLSGQASLTKDDSSATRNTPLSSVVTAPGVTFHRPVINSGASVRSQLTPRKEKIGRSYSPPKAAPAMEPKLKSWFEKLGQKKEEGTRCALA